MIMYSDDQGASWTLGAALPNQWNECALTELRNGSVVLSPRIDDPENTDRHHPDTNVTRVRTTRGFGRSDDGGATFAQTWTLYERQPEILDAPCSDAIVYSNRTGMAYFGHPGPLNNSARTNYTLLRSKDQGETWSIWGKVVYPSGAGYSAMALLNPMGHSNSSSSSSSSSSNDPTVATDSADGNAASTTGDVLGIAFQRTLWDGNLEGGGYNMGFAVVEVEEGGGGTE